MAPVIKETGVTEMRLFTIGTPISRSISRPTFTRFSACRAMRLYTRLARRRLSSQTQLNREMPMVIVRTSSFSWSIIRRVSKIWLV